MPCSSARRQSLAPRQRRAYQPAREAQVTFGIVQQAEIGAAGVGRRIVDAAVRIDLEHERRAVGPYAKIAAAEARSAKRDEKTRRRVANPGGELGIGNRK